LRSRYYNTNTGRFSGIDTFVGDTNSPLTLHKYLYTADNPVNYQDPSGHDLIGAGFTVASRCAGSAGSSGGGHSPDNAVRIWHWA
jgi:hypothetical protein